ncbi:kinesin-like protein KIN-14P [Prosopis cineraria]|uniref:kinesin-like protein KIN-14P n=1 Tax=Prosopis cineraria TaxID=364024 RepID=UPI00240F0608|nr:kinesin-like protein KIN-14P [Prosopis cineraria]
MSSSLESRSTAEPRDSLGDNTSSKSSKLKSSRGNASCSVHFSSQSAEAQRRLSYYSKIQNVLSNPALADSSAAYPVDQTFRDVFQLKRGSYADLPPEKISEMMKSKTLDNAPTQSLLSVVNGILEEGVERRNGEIPPRVACLLRKVVQEIERRIATQADHLRTQNNLFKAREDKYQSRIKVLEALASGSTEESEVFTNQVQQLKIEKTRVEYKKADEENISRLMEEQDQKDMEISRLKQEMETMKTRYEEDFSKVMKEQDQKNIGISRLKKKMETMENRYEEDRMKVNEEDANRLMEEQDQNNMEISMVKQEMETMKCRYEGDVSKLMKEKDQKNMEISRLKQQMEIMKSTHEEDMKKANGEVTNRLMKEQDQKNMEISRLKQEMETIKSTYEEDMKKANGEVANRLMKEQDQKNMEISRLKREMETMKNTYEEDMNKANGEVANRMKEQDQKNMEISRLKREMETMKSMYELRCSQLETEAQGAKGEIEHKSQEYEHLLKDIRHKMKQVEASFESECQKWNMKQNKLHNSLDFQFSTVQNLKLSWKSIQQDVMQENRVYSDECNKLGLSLQPLVKAAENHHAVLAENRKLFNEVQELKGNIRVYCRVRPFLPGQKEKKSIVEHAGENDLVVASPSKQGKDALRSFKFNRVFGPATTQVEVYSDIQPFIRSVLDGYNVCIFAYGQTGSGKTYTMSGPNGVTKETYGVNYRALNDLFSISENRRTSVVYEIGVQIVEIYNEQVRDLLSSDGSQKKTLGISNHSQHKGLAVPDANLFPVKSTSDVMDLMDIGLKNRASSATAMNERSSRSHSVVSIHVRGTDVKSGSSLFGNLHLVDLAGSERVDRSEVTGDRLKEAQHINKSLSALGDVIFALSQKSSHIPYRNSKLTQLLQSSLGGQAKTLMFVQVNPDVNSTSETLSTLKFAERVSGVELGAARSTKEGRDVRELMEQVASLKDTISEKDEEIERLQLLKDLKNSGTR